MTYTHKERRKTHKFLAVAFTERERHTHTQDAKVHSIGLWPSHKERRKTHMFLAVAFTHRERRKTQKFTRLACGLHTHTETQDAQVYSIGL